jgi:hypothetical protein
LWVVKTPASGVNRPFGGTVRKRDKVAMVSFKPAMPSGSFGG